MQNYPAIKCPAAHLIRAGAVQAWASSWYTGEGFLPSLTGKVE